ncbi:hypothetical protein N5K21_22340 [Rhizobium pusense]|uniref:Uncharacterized protein n=1 Tax=Agrobacterium pusense TaxID=648995 RepID=A0A6H0ZRH6_9HYPH|nr:hypothetical protein [Agrobacterium pusense]MDH2091474.1 hypothetical protein [Agrobacterium pusense]QIX22614.1 hypothetical protein FOB41_16435 [Agrobacterium pusense]WCK24525.1 hypothetical protein CFBP5496_0002735 [Agrobacterium pusense]
MSDIEFIKRLPARIAHRSGHEGVEMYQALNGTYFIDSGDPHCGPQMSWESWVAFARKIIAADDAARVGGGV